MSRLIKTIVHITTAAEWKAAQAAGEHHAPSLATEGFIHCCEHGQVARVMQKWFKGKTGLLLLEIDPSRLRATLKYEAVPGTGELYPHLYGPLNADAVIAVSEYVSD